MAKVLTLTRAIIKFALFLCDTKSGCLFIIYTVCNMSTSPLDFVFAFLSVFSIVCLSVALWSCCDAATIVGLTFIWQTLQSTFLLSSANVSKHVCVCVCGCRCVLRQWFVTLRSVKYIKERGIVWPLHNLTFAPVGGSAATHSMLMEFYSSVLLRPVSLLLLFYIA